MLKFYKKQNHLTESFDMMWSRNCNSGFGQLFHQIGQNTFLKNVFWSVTCTESFRVSSFKSSQNILSILSMLFESSFFNCNTTQKTKISVMDFFSKCHQIRRKLRIWLHLLKKSLMENFIFLCNANFWVTNYIFEIPPAESLQTFEVFCPRCLLLY